MTTQTALETLEKKEVALRPISEHKKLDIDLLIQTMRVQTASRAQDMMVKFIVDFLEKNKIPYYVDNGNIYATKGTVEIYPCSVSHMDTVHSIVKNFGVYKSGDFLFSMNNDTLTQAGIGGDDKVGVYITLEMLLYYPAIKAAFFRDEEIGLLGSGALDRKFFENVGYAIQNDRRGNADFVYDIFGPIASKEYLDVTKDVREKYGYRLSDGSCTDIMNVSEKINVSCTNLSCGYFNPHTDHEYISMSDVEHTMNFNIDLINVLGLKKYELETNARKKKQTSNYSGDYWNSYGYQGEAEKNKRHINSQYSSGSSTYSDYDDHYPEQGMSKPRKQKIEGATDITIAQVYESVDIENNRFTIKCDGCKNDIKLDLYADFDAPIVCSCKKIYIIVDEHIEVDK